MKNTLKPDQAHDPYALMLDRHSAAGRQLLETWLPAESLSAISQDQRRYVGGLNMPEDRTHSALVTGDDLDAVVGELCRLLDAVLGQCCYVSFHLRSLDPEQRAHVLRLLDAHDAANLAAMECRGAA